MSNTFCTIITAGYYPRALALFRSICKFDPQAKLEVLVTDGVPLLPISPVPDNMYIVAVSTIMNYSLTKDLYNKYAHTHMNEFRWAMKPVLISYLLEKGFDKVLYLDCDMFFVNDYTFLYLELNDAGVLLTPNWNNMDPLIDKGGFLSSFTGGIFSAGFIGANKEGLPALLWWANACHFMMGAFINIGIGNDQRYLDVLPVYFEQTKIIRHRGCNIGSWNVRENKRVSLNGETLILGKYPVIFIHFDEMLVKNILRGHDQLLLPYLQEYQKSFEKDRYQLSDYLKVFDTHTNAGLLKKLKWKLRLRTRIKRIFYQLSQKL
jgi:hypothetical protein